MESPKLDPRVKLFESFSSLNASTLGPSLRDSISKVRPEIQRLSDIFAVTPFTFLPDNEKVKSSLLRVSYEQILVDFACCILLCSPSTKMVLPIRSP